jgi:hypothetical protein
MKLRRWSKVSPNYLGTTCQVKGLEEGCKYEFRVIAENLLGQSEPLVTAESVTAKWPFSNLFLYSDVFL